MKLPTPLYREVVAQAAAVAEGRATEDEAVKLLADHAQATEHVFVRGCVEAPLRDALVRRMRAHAGGGVDDDARLALFPPLVAGVPRREATLRLLDAHATEMERLGANHTRRNQERREYVNSLIAAAGGDLDISHDVAHAALPATSASAAS